MTMWRVTVAPIENLNAWKSFVNQGIIGIGWPSREFETDQSVVQFKQIQIGDWIVAHVPASHGGGPTIALGIGRVVGPYQEINQSDLHPADNWSGRFRRQYPVKWRLAEHLLRGILKVWLPTVRKLSPEQEEQVLELFDV